MNATRGERTIAVLGAALSLVLTWRIWSVVAAAQNTWPFPALYFIELAAFTLASAILYVVSSPSRHILTWITVGVLTAFSILGAWTVGLYYAPLAGLFLILAVGGDLRHGGRLLMHAAVAALAAVAEAAAILLLARLM
ncbi:MAG TPA: hypothetical protein VFH29_02235 [Anaerolineales bacterium]|nr:hypothetical protein [Anaerolineales bacterium]